MALEVRVPAAPTVEVADTLQLAARALDKNGDSIPATIDWRTADPAVTVIPGTGQVIGQAVGTARVQAVSGSLASDPITVTVVARPDSVVLVGPDTQTVPAGQITSAPLVAKLITNQPPTPGPVANQHLIYSIILPAFADPATRTVQLSNVALVDTVTTDVNGTPSTPVTVGRVAGTTSPDSAVVEVRAVRRRGAQVPGSGQRFVVRFK